MIHLFKIFSHTKNLLILNQKLIVTKLVTSALESVSFEKIRKFARRSWKFIDAYRNGLRGLEALYAEKFQVMLLIIIKQIRNHMISKFFCQKKNYHFLNDFQILDFESLVKFGSVAQRMCKLLTDRIRAG